MPITLDIIEGGHVVKLVVHEPWTLGELTGQYQKEDQYFGACPFKVHTLIDLREMRQVPKGALAQRNSPNIAHPNSGHVAIFGASAVARSIAELAFRLSRFHRARFFEGESDALAYLRAAIATERATR